MKTTPIVRLDEAYGRAYPVREDLWLGGFEVTDLEAGRARVWVEPAREGFRGLRVSHAGETWDQDHGEIELSFTVGPERQERDYTLWARFADDELGPWEITVRYFGTQFYRERGFTGHPDVYLCRSQPVLQQRHGDLRDWELAVTDEDRAFAAEEWGELLAGITGDWPRAQILCSRLFADLRPNVDVPDDAMRRAAPREQYRRLKTGEGKGYCEQVNQVFVYALRCCGIIAREVYMSDILAEDAAAMVEIGSSHHSVEIYSRELNHWLWIDSNMGILGAFLGEEGPLSLAELSLFINQAARRERLRFLVPSPDDQEARRVAAPDVPRPTWEYLEEWGTSLKFRTQRILKAH